MTTVANATTVRETQTPAADKPASATFKQPTPGTYPIKGYSNIQAKYAVENGQMRLSLEIATAKGNVSVSSGKPITLPKGISIAEKTMIMVQVQALTARSLGQCPPDLWSRHVQAVNKFNEEVVASEAKLKGIVRDADGKIMSPEVKADIQKQAYQLFASLPDPVEPGGAAYEDICQRDRQLTSLPGLEGKPAMTTTNLELASQLQALSSELTQTLKQEPQGPREGAAPRAQQPAPFQASAIRFQ